MDGKDDSELQDAAIKQQDDSELLTQTWLVIPVIFCSLPSFCIHRMKSLRRIPHAQVDKKHKQKFQCDVDRHSYVVELQSGLARINCVCITFPGMNHVNQKLLVAAVLGRLEKDGPWPWKDLQKKWKKKKKIGFAMVGRGATGTDENLPLAIFLHGNVKSSDGWEEALQEAQQLLSNAI